MHQSDRVRLQFGYVQNIPDPPQCLKEHHRMHTNKSKKIAWTELFHEEQQCWTDRESYMLQGIQLEEETKPSQEYMHWYRSLPIIYASYEHYLTDPRSIPSGSQQQPQPQPQPQPFQQQPQPQPQHQFFQQQPQPQFFQQQPQPFQQQHPNPNYSQLHTSSPYVDPQYTSYTQYTPSHSQTNYNYQTQHQQSPYIQQNPSTSSHNPPPTTSYFPTVIQNDPPRRQSTPNLNLDLNINDFDVDHNIEFLTHLWSPQPPTQETQEQDDPTHRQH
ncbi:uncharacterized protein LOC131596823 [Vicia villosa]|uniref:uncharacterized protein LOC131596823 n=1 Tax=Vicia villosa TaxID=3911 RepID=UPI00273B7FA9|nr:uncharacterized protein LOC131596823 [Vicia villosa]